MSIYYDKYKKELDELAIDEHVERVELAYKHAKAFITDTNQVSISKIQRALRIGYNHAASIVERMESEGLISKPTSDGYRHVLDAAYSIDTGISHQVEKKKKLLELMREAEKLAYDYFQNCEVGSERNAAAQVYENIRTATMVRCS
ncbi:hypothetical protein J7384_17970 [Endozoicomonas sp. G2_1]|uniref:DNA translocase FtsK n=1 Tax=Endozoicomonas sp. G2_1 TaxID=2821091 RepID=UPI001ADD10DD|nr:DNA translocase FtsK [Endozoicomonas sp. G2_1]MBO9492254.1 hypothetical protein [Endozoicomonas sp. G2_1]